MIFFRQIRYWLDMLRMRLFMKNELKTCRRYQDLLESFASAGEQPEGLTRSALHADETLGRKRELRKLAYWLELQDSLEAILKEDGKESPS